MDCFWCEVIHGELILKEAEDAKWLTKEHLADVKWLPADVTLIEKIGEALYETKDKVILLLSISCSLKNKH